MHEEVRASIDKVLSSERVQLLSIFLVHGRHPTENKGGKQINLPLHLPNLIGLPLCHCCLGPVPEVASTARDQSKEHPSPPAPQPCLTSSVSARSAEWTKSVTSTKSTSGATAARRRAALIAKTKTASAAAAIIPRSRHRSGVHHLRPSQWRQCHPLGRGEVPHCHPARTLALPNAQPQCPMGRRSATASGTTRI